MHPVLIYFKILHVFISFNELFDNRLHWKFESGILQLYLQFKASIKFCSCDEGYFRDKLLLTYSNILIISQIKPSCYSQSSCYITCSFLKYITQSLCINYDHHLYSPEHVNSIFQQHFASLHSFKKDIYYLFWKRILFYFPREHKWQLRIFNWK